MADRDTPSRRKLYTIWSVEMILRLILHPRNLTWNPNMEVWKMFFLSKWVMSRFQPMSCLGENFCRKNHAGVCSLNSSQLGALPEIDQEIDDTDCKQLLVNVYYSYPNQSHYHKQS